MAKYKYLIIGGGMTAAAAVDGIREIDREGTIGIISSEPDPPYARPPLSKMLWKGQSLDAIWRNTSKQGVALHLGQTAEKLDAQARTVTDDRGQEYSYEALLLATGGTPRRLPFGPPSVIYYRTVDDYRRLRGLADQGRSFAVIGGGFIGSEVAAALAMNGKEVSLLFPEEAIGWRIFPPDLARFVTDYYRRKGVSVLDQHTVQGIAQQGDRLTVASFALGAGQQVEIEVDGIVAGIGIQPNVKLAQQIGLQVENGIVVDEHLRTSRPEIYAAGDVASFCDSALGEHRRVEHEDNANTMGRIAGRNMAGTAERYDHLSFFYSDLFELGYEAVGDTDPRLDLVQDWQEPFHKGIVYYLRDGRVRGVLLWNVWGQVEAARRLIAAPGPFRPEDLRGRLPA